MSIKSKILFYSVSITGAFLYDVLFSTARYPIILLCVCGIVLVYERVSPLIYSSR